MLLDLRSLLEPQVYTLPAEPGTFTVTGSDSVGVLSRPAYMWSPEPQEAKPVPILVTGVLWVPFAKVRLVDFGTVVVGGSIPIVSLGFYGTVLVKGPAVLTRKTFSPTMEAALVEDEQFLLNGCDLTEMLGVNDG